VIPRWQLVAVYVLIVAAGALGITQTQHVAHRADALARDIQAQRVSSIVQSCEQQNARHDATIATLDRLIRQQPAGQRRRAERSRASTVLLIDALAPMRDCQKVLREFTRSP
jgi:hypothetical protein